MLRVRWLGQVPYEEAHALQRALHDRGSDDYLLMLEHPHVVTLGVRAEMSHVLVDPASVGAHLVRTDRGGDVTYHGPGQLVVYPLLSIPMGTRAVPCYVHSVEQVVIDALGDLGFEPGRLGRLDGFPGVWVDPDGASPRKICAIGIRVTKGRSMHGLALNVDPDIGWFSRIVPCGIADKPVTSLALEGLELSMAEVVDAVCDRAVAAWAHDGRFDRQDVAGLRPRGLTEAQRFDPEHPADRDARSPGPNLKIRLRQAGVDPDHAIALVERKPPWLRAPVVMGDRFRRTGRTLHELDLVTVCEEAGCPNIYECWADGTATFMINGDRCTRACGFCLVDTRRPLAVDPAEPSRVAEAISRMGLAHAVITAVARDDLQDGGAAGFASTIRSVRERCPSTTIEVLIPDCKGDAASLDVIFGERPEILNHNLETVARLQRAVRPSAGYARSLSLLARAAGSGLVTKSGLILGMGETRDEVLGALADLRAVGVSIVTLGQYLRPSARHVPVARWWTPEEFADIGSAARQIGFDHVEASPLTRSSYHARAAMESAGAGGPGRASAHEAVIA